MTRFEPRGDGAAPIASLSGDSAFGRSRHGGADRQVESPLNEAMGGGAIGACSKSRHASYQEGDVVQSMRIP